MSADAHTRWDLIVRDGIYASVGMPGFAHLLSEADSRAVQAYVVNQTRVAIAFCESEYPDLYPELFGTACTKRVVASESPATGTAPGE